MPWRRSADPRGVAVALAALLVGAPAGAEEGADAALPVASVAVRGSELVVRAGGRALARADLIGAVLDLALEGGGTASVRIDAILTDPGRSEGDVVLYDLSVAGDGGSDGGSDGGAWAPACPPEPDGKPHAVLQPRPDGTVAILCTAGAQGKCIRLGYRPWAERDGVALAPYWDACVRMIRADYCGDARPTTRDGILINIHDDLGIQRRDPEADLGFEAAWDDQGAICVAHPRVPQNVSLDVLAADCPRLAGHLGPGCTEAAARRLGTPLLFNDSRGDGVPEDARRPRPATRGASPG